MIRALILVGSITWYSGPYVGEPLRCGSANGASPLYDTTHQWIAVDIDAYPAWRCGDLVRVDAEGVQLLLWVKDSGPLSAYNIGGVEIVADLPEHLWRWPGLSVQGSVVNVTAGLRERMEVER